jgi:hypothetical protein
LKTILIFGVWQLVAMSVLAVLGAIWYANRERIIESVSCAFIAGITSWLGQMIHQTIQMM